MGGTYQGQRRQRRLIAKSVALTDVRSVAHCGLKSGISGGPKGAMNGLNSATTRPLHGAG